jgi:hypothetical protein
MTTGRINQVSVGGYRTKPIYRRSKGRSDTAGRPTESCKDSVNQPQGVMSVSQLTPFTIQIGSTSELAESGNYNPILFRTELPVFIYNVAGFHRLRPAP